MSAADSARARPDPSGRRSGLMQLVTLSLRVFFRDLTRGQLNTLIGALILAISAIATTGILADRLDRTVGEEAGEILGADLVIRGRSEIPTEWREAANRLALRHIEIIEFSTMLLEGDATLLVGVKAVEEGYPLRGDLTSEGAQGLRAKGSKSIPQPGEAWVDPPALRRLNLSRPSDHRWRKKTNSDSTSHSRTGSQR